MAVSRLTDLTAATLPLSGAESAYIEQSGNARSATVNVFSPQASPFENVYGGIGITTVANATQISKRPYIVPAWIEGVVSAQRTIKQYMSRAAGTSLNMTAGYAWYSMANSTQLTRYASESFAVSMTTSALWSGVRELVFQPTAMSSNSLSAGMWWLAMYIAGSNDSTAVQQFNMYGANRGQSAVSGSIFSGTNASSATAATNQFFQFAGLHSATQATNTPFPATIAQSDVTGGAGSGISPTIYFQIIP
jgi:hypothetical protein